MAVAVRRTSLVHGEEKASGLVVDVGALHVVSGEVVHKLRIPRHTAPPCEGYGHYHHFFSSPPPPLMKIL